MNEKLKKLLYPIFGAVVAIFAFLVPVFNIYDVSIEEAEESEVLSGYQSMASNSSFTFMLIVGLLIAVCVLLVILAFFEADPCKQKKCITMATLILVVASVFYFIFGCTMVDKFNEEYEDYKKFADITISNPTIWPMLISIVLAVVNFFFPQIVEKITAPKPVVAAPVAPVAPVEPVAPVAPVAEPEVATAAAPASVNDLAATLKKYKALLDAGAITQEEYDKMKDNLLNG